MDSSICDRGGGGGGGDGDCSGDSGDGGDDVTDETPLTSDAVRSLYSSDLECEIISARTTAGTSPGLGGDRGVKIIKPNQQRKRNSTVKPNLGRHHGHKLRQKIKKIPFFF